MVKKYGTREEVVAGLAMQTKGGLAKGDLFAGADGKIKSKRASAAARGGRAIVPVQRRVAAARSGGRMIPANLQGYGVIQNIAGAVARHGEAFVRDALKGAAKDARKMLGLGPRGSGKVGEAIVGFLGKVKTALGTAARFLSNEEIKKVANAVADFLIATGLPQAALAGATVMSMIGPLQTIFGTTATLLGSGGRVAFARPRPNVRARGALLAGQGALLAGQGAGMVPGNLQGF